MVVRVCRRVCCAHRASQVARIAALGALLLLSGRAKADVEDHGADYDPGKAKRRSDFAAGFTFAGAFGSVNGYPNEVAKIDVERYHARTGAAGGEGIGLWLGAALRDWLVVGIGAKGTTVAGSGGTQSMGGAFVVHLQAYPAFSLGGAFRDLALMGDFGLGSRKINYASKEVADGGAVSALTFGVLYEGLRAGKHVSSGPFVQVSHEFSGTISATIVAVGLQLAYYGGPG